MAMFKCSGALFNGTIQINTVAGATVTATTSGTTRAFTATADVTGLATIRVKKRGTYAIASTGTTRIAHAVVSSATPVTAYYTWTKWNCKTVYAMSTNVQSHYVSETIYGSCYYYGRGTGYSFDPDTGNYTLTGGSAGIVYPTSGQTTIATEGQYAMYSTEQGATTFSGMLQASGYIYGYALQPAGTVKQTWFYNNDTGAVTVYGSTSGYGKGDTQYADATGTALDTYPTNGRNTEDGYWYVAA